jgi:DNA-binding response OmpR family regulator
MLPGLNGLAMLGAIRAAGVKTPTLILSALGTVDDRIDGLNAGADDYLVKPFSFAELTARIDAKDAAVGHIDDIQIAGAVERRPFEKTVDRVVARGAAGATLRAVAKLLRQTRKYCGGNDGESVQHDGSLDGSVMMGGGRLLQL